MTVNRLWQIVVLLLLGIMVILIATLVFDNANRDAERKADDFVDCLRHNPAVLCD